MVSRKIICSQTLLLLGLCLGGLAPGRAGAAQNSEDATVFNGQKASALLNQVRYGIEGHMQKQMLDAFELSRMSGGQAFQNQIAAFFDRYDAIRTHFHVRETSMENGKGVVLVDIEMELEQQGSSAPPTRKQAQLRFMAEKGAHGWRFTDVQPRNFFS